jgi:hypothetical protein
MKRDRFTKATTLDTSIGLISGKLEQLRAMQSKRLKSVKFTANNFTANIVDEVSLYAIGDEPSLEKELAESFLKTAISRYEEQLAKLEAEFNKI